MTSKAVWTIGVGQCVGWGVLYYAFGVLLVPVERDLGVPRWIVSGAFSAALLSSALVAPTIGRLADRGYGPAVMQAGGLTAAGLLALWATSPGLWTSYVIWIAIGVCMAAILYEPVFAIIGREVADGHDRLRAIATITVLGGLSSTIFWPLTGWLVERSGWRVAVYWLASTLAITTLAVHRWGFKNNRARDNRIGNRLVSRQSVENVATDGYPNLNRLLFTFACSSFAGSAMATNLVPALIERRLDVTTAATVAGLLGVMQLPGRLLVMNGRVTLTAAQVVWVSLALQVVGLADLIWASTLPAIIAGLTLFACGSGLSTVARPYVVLFLYGADRAGHLNGVIARGQQLARAAGPVAAASVATAAGSGYLFAILAGVLVAASATVVALRSAAAHPTAVQAI